LFESVYDLNAMSGLQNLSLQNRMNITNCAVAQLLTAPPRGCPPRGFKPDGRPQVHKASLLPLVIKAYTFFKSACKIK
jgi:hypothetical protein